MRDDLGTAIKMAAAFACGFAVAIAGVCLASWLFP